MGFPIDCVVDASGERRVDENLLCPLCLDVLDDPVSGACGHASCRECLGQHLSNHSDCPQCRGALSQNALVPNVIVRSMVSELRLVCPNNPSSEEEPAAKRARGEAGAVLSPALLGEAGAVAAVGIVLVRAAAIVANGAEVSAELKREADARQRRQPSELFTTGGPEACRSVLRWFEGTLASPSTRSMLCILSPYTPSSLPPSCSLSAASATLAVIRARS